MKRYPALFLLLCLFLAPACRERRQTVRLLDGIQGYAEAHPDSTRAALENISPALLSTPSLRARQALMLSTAQDRNGLNVKQDSCINVAVDYYKQHGSRQDCFLSYYYQGRVYENARDHEAALNSYLLAESYISDKTTDSYLSASSSIDCRSVARTGHRQGRGQWQNARGIRAYAASSGQRDVLPRPESGLYAGKWRCKENAFQGT